MTDDAAHRLARSAKERRLAFGWSIDELVARSGVSKGAIVAVENGSTNPSLSTLVRLADALGASVTSLLGEPEATPVNIVRHDALDALWTGPSGGRATLILTVPGHSSVELWEWTLMPNERYVSHPHPNGVVETITVQSGVLELSVDDETWEVPAGATASFGADRHHSYAAPSETTTFLMTVHLRSSHGASGPDPYRIQKESPFQ